MDSDELAAVRTAVGRALAARTSDRHLIDDLTQETLLRVARADPRLADDDLRAYAVVTARNLLNSHFRAQSVQRRHQHRLVEPANPMDPEQRTIDNEETAALASALRRLDPGDRDLLLRHEVTGTDLATLAGETAVSRGAIAMRLARARANLRLEFLLTFRRLSLPTPECRPVLLALAARDRRRETQLDAGGHLEMCRTCAELLGPMIERDRRIAAWLFVPLGDVLRRLRRAFHAWWVRAVTIAMLLAAIGGLVVIDPWGADDVPSGARDVRNPVPAVSAPTPSSTTASSPAVDAPPPVPAAAPPVTPVPQTAVPTTPAVDPGAPALSTAAPSDATVAPPTAGNTGEQAPSCPPAAPLDSLELPAAVGCPFAVSVVTVVAVPSSTQVRATAGPWSLEITLVGGSTSPLTVLPGARISIAGTVDSAAGGEMEVTAGLV